MKFKKLTESILKKLNENTVEKMAPNGAPGISKDPEIPSTPLNPDSVLVDGEWKFLANPKIKKMGFNATPLKEGEPYKIEDVDVSNVSRSLRGKIVWDSTEEINGIETPVTYSTNVTFEDENNTGGWDFPPY